MATGTIVFDGNSLTLGAVGGGTPYPSAVMSQLALGAGLVGNNQGAGGISITEMNTRAVATIDPLFSAGPVNILCVFEGTNDFQWGGSPADQTFGKTVRYCLDRKARGWTVIAATMPAMDGTFGHITSDQCEARRLAYNALMRQHKAAYCDAFVDLGADAMFASQAAARNATYYIDQVHMTTAGYSHMASLFVTAIQSVL